MALREQETLTEFGIARVIDHHFKSVIREGGGETTGKGIALEGNKFLERKKNQRVKGGKSMSNGITFEGNNKIREGWEASTAMWVNKCNMAEGPVDFHHIKHLASSTCVGSDKGIYP